MRNSPKPGSMMDGSSLLSGFLGFVVAMVVLSLLALLVFFLVKKAREKKSGPGAPGPMRPQHRPPLPPALQILDERLARGEIEIDDYMTRKAALLGGGPATNEWVPPASAPRPDAVQPEAPPAPQPDAAQPP